MLETQEAVTVQVDRLAAPARRLICLDAYRGLVMLAMASSGLALAKVAKQFPDSGLWQFLGHEFEHVRWRGCAAWDLIQPSFFFIVGVALPFSVAARRTRGQSWGWMLLHAMWRSLLLILLGVFLFSDGAKQTNWTFVNTLTQIGLAYCFVFLLVGRPRAVQVAAVAAVLVGYWYWFYQHPLPLPGADLAAFGMPAKWSPMAGVAAHWEIAANPAVAFDRWFLNLFPRPEPFRFREGGYTTLNCIPTIATMALGMIAGEVLRSSRTDGRKLRYLLLAGVACVLIGAALDPSILPGVETTRWTLCPIIKRIWTPSWAVYSAGLATLTLAAMYWSVEMRGWRRWTFPLVVVGMNSIVMFCLASLSRRWVGQTLLTHLGQQRFAGTYGPILQELAILLVLWLVCLWLYRKRVFVRI